MASDINAHHRTIFGKLAVCALLATATFTASAQSGGCCIGGVTKGDAKAIGIGIVGGAVALGVGIYFAVHHGHSLRGCAVSGPSGLELQNRGDQQTYSLTGAVASVKPGDQVRVSGRKQKKSGGAPPQFLVDSVTKDYGSCTAGLATPQVAKKD
jgi:hypothetical protein